MNLKEKRILAHIEDYKRTFSTENGKRVLWDLMKKNGMLSDIFTENPQVSAYNEGRRAVVLYILQKLNTDIQKLQQQIEEGIKNENELRLNDDEPSY
jgi:hypothetical protein